MIAREHIIGRKTTEQNTLMCAKNVKKIFCGGFAHDSIAKKKQKKGERKVNLTDLFLELLDTPKEVFEEIDKLTDDQLLAIIDKIRKEEMKNDTTN